MDLPETLTRHQAEPLCRLHGLCDRTGTCDGDCDNNAQVQQAWTELRARLNSEDDLNDFQPEHDYLDDIGAGALLETESLKAARRIEEKTGKKPNLALYDEGYDDGFCYGIISPYCQGEINVMPYRAFSGNRQGKARRGRKFKGRNRRKW